MHFFGSQSANEKKIDNYKYVVGTILPLFLVHTYLQF